MLSRVAESLMWMARYLERANSLSRIVEAVEEFSLDHHHPELSNEEAFWSPVYDVLNLSDQKECYIKEENELSIIHHLLLDRDNMSSVASCIAAARFNARGVRDQIMDEAWEVINDLHLYCKEQGESNEDVNVAEFGAKIRHSVLCFRGLVCSTMEQTEAWGFLLLGMRIERADQTSRLLDLQTFMLASDRRSKGLLEPYLWLIVLKVSSGNTTGFASSKSYWKKIENSLLFDVVQPNSIRSLVSKVNDMLHHLSGARPGIVSNEAEQACSLLQADLDLKALTGLDEEDLHQYIDRVQQGLVEISNAILQEYIYIS